VFIGHQSSESLGIQCICTDEGTVILDGSAVFRMEKSCIIKRSKTQVTRSTVRSCISIGNDDPNHKFWLQLRTVQYHTKDMCEICCL